MVRNGASTSLISPLSSQSACVSWESFFNDVTHSLHECSTHVLVYSHALRQNTIILNNKYGTIEL